MSANLAERAAAHVQDVLAKAALPDVAAAFEAHDALDTAVAGMDAAPDAVARWHAMIGPRNRWVHGDERISDAQLTAHVHRGLEDFRVFEALARGWLQAG